MIFITKAAAFTLSLIKKLALALLLSVLIIAAAIPFAEYGLVLLPLLLFLVLVVYVVRQVKAERPDTSPRIPSKRRQLRKSESISQHS